MNVAGVERSTPDPQPRKKVFRFRLRTLFALVLVSAFVAWWTMAPTRKMNWLVNEVNKQESETAMAMLKSFEKDESWQRTLIRHLANGKKVKAVKPKTEISVAPVSFADIVFGVRRFTVVHGYDVETVDGSRNYGYSSANAKMTRSGIR